MSYEDEEDDEELEEDELIILDAKRFSHYTLIYSAFFNNQYVSAGVLF